jgi:hypothetical protein
VSRWRLFGVVVSALTAGVLGFTLVPAQSAGEGEEVMRVCDPNRAGFNKDIDVGDQGFSAGDYSVFADKVKDTRTGRKAGHLYGHLTFVRPRGNRDAALIGDVVLFTPTGKISAQIAGRFSDFEKGTSFPVTGGAGHFAHATGSVFVKNGPCDGVPGIRLKVVTKH